MIYLRYSWHPRYIDILDFPGILDIFNILTFLASLISLKYMVFLQWLIPFTSLLSFIIREWVRVDVLKVRRNWLIDWLTWWFLLHLLMIGMIFFKWVRKSRMFCESLQSWVWLIVKGVGIVSQYWIKLWKQELLVLEQKFEWDTLFSAEGWF